MGDAGSPHARFRRALLTKNMFLIDVAAKELPQVSLADALRILVVMAEKRDDRYDRAAGRWAQRAADEAEVPVAKTWPLLDRLSVAPEETAAELRDLSDATRRRT
jgi:hypothetical protein